MVMFDNIEEIFQDLRNFNEYSKALVTLATATGTLLILFYFLRSGWALIQGFRLYVLSQFCCHTDFIKRYGKWACISGATDGIGLSMAKELARRGHSIIVIGRNDEKLARVKVNLEEEPNVGEVVTVKIDLSDSSIDNFENIRSQIGFETRDIGILINNAGVAPDKLKRFGKVHMEDLQTIINLNILATLYLTRMALPGMLYRGRGLILNVSSVAGTFVGPYMSVYGATKTFINRFSEQLQIEYSSQPIDIINLTPGAVHTKLYTNIAKSAKPGLVNISPDDYAKSTLNAVSTRISSISGTIFHGFTFIVIGFSNTLGLTQLVYYTVMRLFAKDMTLSPATKRKNSNSIGTNEASI